MRTEIARRALASFAVCAALAGCAGLPSTQRETTGAHALEFALVRNGEPVVVFENGLGATMARSWPEVYAEIGKQATVFAYNRPGYGASDPPATSRDGGTIVEELRATLRRHDLRPPYVLVGHSMGGLYMQLFARRHPDEVAGLVLVDATHPTQFEGEGAIERQPWLVRTVFGFWLVGTPQEEFAALAQTGHEVLRAPAFTGKPVIVLSARDRDDTDLARFANEKRADLARLYPGSKQVWVDGGHNIQREHPQIVIDAIREVIAAIPR